MFRHRSIPTNEGNLTEDLSRSRNGKRVQMYLSHPGIQIWIISIICRLMNEVVGRLPSWEDHIILKPYRLHLTLILGLIHYHWKPTRNYVKRVFNIFLNITLTSICLRMDINHNDIIEVDLFVIWELINHITGGYGIPKMHILKW